MSTPQRNVLTFQWDSRESLGGDRFLTPVYFNRQVLTRYLYDSRFTCEFASETYGTIHGPDFYISFGINRNGSVIAWLGDLMDRIPLREQFYWLVENKEPENDAASEFYDAQINVAFTKPPLVIRCLNDIAAKITSMIRANVSNRIERLRNTGHQFGMPATKRGLR